MSIFDVKRGTLADSEHLWIKSLCIIWFVMVLRWILLGYIQVVQYALFSSYMYV